MKKGIAFGLGMILGTAIGGAFSWAYAKEKYEKICNDEVRETREIYTKMAHELHEKNLKETTNLQNKLEKESLNSIVTNYQTDSPKIIGVDLSPKEPETIFEVDQLEFGTEEGQQLETLYYFEQNDILTDDKFEIVSNREELIANTLDNFGDKYDGVMYVRNTVRNVDFEVLLDDRNFEEI